MAMMIGVGSPSFSQPQERTAMKVRQSSSIILAAILSCIAMTPALSRAEQDRGQAAQHNQLTAAEQAAGWKLLFDGKSTDAWRGYRKQGFPDKGWEIEDQCLKVKTKGKGGDIITRDQYGDFELVLEWRVSEKASSGIIYRLTEKHGASWQ
ncbi:MAG: DUF1080 domain-containing protein, partial [Planctomycetes bacterium]|nr:DUF1080 domain-containing protein [Planctomycetota bacterium]